MKEYPGQQTSGATGRKGANTSRRQRNWPIAKGHPVRQLCNISSVRFSHSLVSDSLRPHGLQHTRPSCPSPAPGVHSNSRPLSQWCHPTLSYPTINQDLSKRMGEPPGKKIEIKYYLRASVMAQWLRICLAMQGTLVWSPAQKDPTCLEATKPLSHNYWAWGS